MKRSAEEQRRRERDPARVRACRKQEIGWNSAPGRKETTT